MVKLTLARLVAQQLLNLSPIPPSPSRPVGVISTPTTVTANDVGRFHMLSNSANVQFIDETETHIQFKRNSNANDSKTKQTQQKNQSGNVGKKLQKRGIVQLDDGSLVDDGVDSSDNSEIYSKYNGLADFGDQQFKHDLTLRMTLEEEISTHDREPAEEEVKAVMAICSNCDPEPFQGAIVFAWKDISEQMNNTLKGLSVGTCGKF